MVEPGRRCLGDRYELHRLIASGGMGQVWRGLDTSLGRAVAVKVLRSEYTGDETFVARFRAEAQHAASLSHPHVAKVFDYGEETVQDGTGETLAYLVMELVEGEPLSAVLRREGALDTETTLSVLAQTGAALAEAHRAGLVHRDVKPGNILVRPDGTVKITDFGIAWSARNVALTRTGQVIGTPQYLSPEQAEGRHATPASDVYALGLIAYECLSGRPAFDGDNAVTIALKQVREYPEPLPSDLPAEVRGLVDRALAKDPDERLADGAAFTAAVEEIRGGHDPDTPPPTVTAARRAAVPPPRSAAEQGPVTRSPAGRRRNRLAMVLLPLLGLVAGGAIAVAVLQALAGENQSPAAAAEPRGTGSIVLDASDYIGRPYQEVTASLKDLGLTVQPRAVQTADQVPGRVLDVDPTGVRLDDGDTVVVSYAVAPSGDGATSGDGGVTGAAVGEQESSAETTAEPSTSDEPVEQAPAPETSTPPSSSPTDQPGSPTSPTGSSSSEPTSDPGSGSSSSSAGASLSNQPVA